VPSGFHCHRLLRLPRPVLTSSREALAHPLAPAGKISAKWWSEWQDLNLRPLVPNEVRYRTQLGFAIAFRSVWCEQAFLDCKSGQNEGPASHDPLDASRIGHRGRDVATYPHPAMSGPGIVREVDVAGRSFHAPIGAKPAITLSRKDWHSHTNRAVV